MSKAPAWFLGMLAGPAPLLAAGGEGGAVNPFAGDIGNALWTLVIFLLVVFVLGKFAWGPVLSALQKRELFIRESLEKAKQDRDAAEARLREYTERIERAQTEASALVEEGRRDAEVLMRKIEEDARAEAAKLLERAKREIGIASDTAIKQIYDVCSTLATEVASKVIRKEINAQEHQRLIAESLEELRQMVRSR
jgi:F-type H+-transporting ATPase subunit b